MNQSKPVWLTISLVAVLILAAGIADEDARYRKIRDALNKFTIVYTQQKVYLHTDKTSYNSGDKIWIKAYLINGMNHQPDTLSTNLYVELIGPTLSRVEIKRFQMFRGFGIGDFTLSDTLAEGLYQLRAYTNWMTNFGEGFFFTKNFPLTNPSYSRRISPKQARVNQKELENRDKVSGDIDIQFMPEGGELVEGLESTVAFKAINPLGKGVNVSGDIVDEKGNRVTQFSSSFKGIGRFMLTPDEGRHYFAEVKDGGQDVRKVLPTALKAGLVMHAEINPQNITVTLRSNKPHSNDRTANEVILVGQTGEGSITIVS